MNLKHALLAALEADQLKAVCNELELEADRRSPTAMSEAIASSKRAKPEILITTMTAAQLREVLRDAGLPSGGGKEDLIGRLLEAAGRAPERGPEPAKPVGPTSKGAPDPVMSDLASEYRHHEEAVQRPNAGVQDQFQDKRPPKTYRYDSSLDPALSWDEQRERDLGEWLLGLVVRASKDGEAVVFAEPQVWKGGGVRVTSLADAAQLLAQIGKPYLNWAGKAERQEIRVPTAPLFVHERHSTKAVLDSIRHRKARGETLDLFGDAGMDIRENLEAYEHRGPWQNRMILGDSLVVMNSLLEFEGLGGQVQMVYIDPPYGVKFGSNFQPFIRKRDVKHGGDEDMTREPEMVKAYRDTWELGLHSYLTYLRDRIAVAKELLAASGSVFVQISEDNLHHVRELLDEAFGPENACPLIVFQKTTGAGSPSGGTDLPPVVNDYLLWYAKDKSRVTYNKIFNEKVRGSAGATQYEWLELDGIRRKATDAEKTEPPDGGRFFAHDNLTSQTGGETTQFEYKFQGKRFVPRKGGWKTNLAGMQRLDQAGRLFVVGDSLRYLRYIDDFPFSLVTNFWTDTVISGFGDPKIYVVQTSKKIVERCLLMSTRPGDLVLDITCGSGTTAFVAEQWGRRWITVDTSRVPLALARQRLLTANFQYYKLKSPQVGPAGGFAYESKKNRRGEEIGGVAARVTLKSIANAEPAPMEILVDRPEVVSGVTRVTGPFVIEATVAPAQIVDRSGSDTHAVADVTTHIQRMIEVLRQSKTLRLPNNRELTFASVRQTVETEYLHAEAKEANNSVAIVFGPADGAVSSTLVFEAAREAYFLKYDRLYFFGFAIEPSARAMIEDGKKLRVPAAYVAVTPDVAMSDLLKTTRSSEIFSITGLPDVSVRHAKKRGPHGEALHEVELKGLDIFDPQSLETEAVEGESVPCWMLDTDYDGLCFYATQVFFPKTSAWDNLQRSLGARFDESVWSHLSGTVSEPFALGERRRIAVKVIDERGNELMRVLDVAE